MTFLSYLLVFLNYITCTFSQTKMTFRTDYLKGHSPRFLTISFNKCPLLCYYVDTGMFYLNINVIEFTKEINE